jgi:hypothetical protein
LPATEPSLGATGWSSWGHAVTTIVNAVETAPSRLDALEAGGGVADGAVTNAKVNAAAAISADKLADGTTNKVMTSAERTKLSGIATAATANSSDATLLARANHTGTQTAATVSDFSEAVDDRVAALLVAGSNVTLTYNDGAGTLTVAATGSTGYATVAEEGSALTQRATVNFIGRSVTAVDNSGSSRTDVTIGDFPIVHAVGNSGVTLTLDAAAAAGYVKTITLTANCTFTLTGAGSSQATTLELVLTQDGTGSRAVTWPASVKWAGGAPTLSTAAGAVDRVVLTTYNAGTTWYGDLIGKGYA